MITTPGTGNSVKYIAASFIAIAMLAACNNAEKKATDPAAAATTATAEEPSKELTGKFSVDGKESTGKVSVQHFASTNEFSVLCQDDNVGLVQITFADEASARTPQEVKFTKGFTHKEKNEADFSFSPFSGNGAAIVSNSSTKGTAKIVKDGADNAIEFTGVELQNEEKKLSGKLSGKIPY